MFDGTASFGTNARYLRADVVKWEEDGTMFDLQLTLTYTGSAVKKAWYFRLTDTLDKVETEAKDSFADYFTDGAVGVGITEMTADGKIGGQWTLSSCEPYDTQWGGTLIVVVTADASNKLKIDNVIRYEGTKDDGKIERTWPVN